MPLIRVEVAGGVEGDELLVLLLELLVVTVTVCWLLIGERDDEELVTVCGDV